MSGCTITDSNPTTQCKTVVSATGAAAKAHRRQRGVVLDTLAAPPTAVADRTRLSATAGQSKLKAV